METPFINSSRMEHLPRDLRTPLPGDLLISEEAMAQIKSRDPQRLEINQQAIGAYFAQTWTALNEILYRPEIKSGPADIIAPPDLLMTHAVPAISNDEQMALGSWMQEQTAGRPMAEIQLQDLDNMRTGIRDFLVRRGHNPDAPPVGDDPGGPDDPGRDPRDTRDAGDPGDRGDDLGRDDDVGGADEGEPGVPRDAYAQFMSDVIDNKLVFDSEQQRQEHEKILVAIRSGKIKSAGEILLWLTYLEIDQVNRRIGRAIELKDTMGRRFNNVIPADGKNPDGSPITAIDQMRMNADMMKFSGDSNQVNLTITTLLNNREKLLTAEGGLGRELGKFSEEALRNIGKVAS